jgi:hypothetical protein
MIPLLTKAIIYLPHLGEGAIMPEYKPLWALSPYELISLFDLMRFYADKFVGVMDSLRGIRDWYNKLRLAEYEVNRGPDMSFLSDLEALAHQLSLLAEISDNVGFESTSWQARRMRRHAESGEYFGKNFQSDLQQLTERVYQDMHGRVCFIISRSDAEEFYENLAPFGQEVNDAFHSAVFDIQEAAKCRVFKRETASVFHLMRALEVPLMVLAHELEVEYEPNWNTFLNRIDRIQQEVRDGRRTRPVDWSQREQFYAEASSLLRNVKNAWRNKVMHLEKKYTPEETERIYNATRDFFKFLSEYLHEDDKDEANTNG